MSRFRDDGKENGNHCSILGLYGDNGKENGNSEFRAWVLGFGA